MFETYFVSFGVAVRPIWVAHEKYSRILSTFFLHMLYAALESSGGRIRLSAGMPSSR